MRNIIPSANITTWANPEHPVIDEYEEFHHHNHLNELRIQSANMTHLLISTWTNPEHPMGVKPDGINGQL